MPMFLSVIVIVLTALSLELKDARTREKRLREAVMSFCVLPSNNCQDREKRPMWCDVCNLTDEELSK